MFKWPLGSGDISSVMGFSGFGKVQKQARKFDLDAIFEKTKREAKTILFHNGTDCTTTQTHIIKTHTKGDIT